MSDNITLYHNPRCSKSRATLELLKNAGNEPQLVEYLKQPPTAETLAGILDDYNNGYIGPGHCDD